MKPMTFLEWDRKIDFHGTSKDCFELARQGMIPEDEAVRIGQVVKYKWKGGPNAKWRKGRVCIFTHDGAHIFDTEIHEVRKVDSVWYPSVSEYVFIKVIGERDKVGNVGKVSKIEDGKIFMVGVDDCCWSPDHIKPFSPEHIGKSWNEIPGGIPTA